MTDGACHDCGLKTVAEGPHHNYYMVKQHLWDHYGVGREFLCVDDLEKRLGRRLTIDDLSDAPINYLTGIREFIAIREALA